MKTLLTIGGLMNVTPPEFKPAEYKGLRQNCGRKLSKAALEAMKRREFTGSALKQHNK